MESKKQKQDTRLIVHTFSELRDCKLTEGQQLLIKGLQRWFRKTGRLSEKQLNILLELKEYAPDKI